MSKHGRGGGWDASSLFLNRHDTKIAKRIILTQRHRGNRETQRFLWL
jgi:hypothetical protein